ncbi:MAG: diguanylate cyclase [bacterium]
MKAIDSKLWKKLLHYVDDLPALYGEIEDWLRDNFTNDPLVLYQPDPLDDLGMGQPTEVTCTVLKGDVSTPATQSIETFPNNKTGVLDSDNFILHFKDDSNWYGAVEGSSPLPTTLKDQVDSLTELLRLGGHFHFHQGRSRMSERLLRINTLIHEEDDSAPLIEELLSIVDNVLPGSEIGYYAPSGTDFELRESTGFDSDEHPERALLSRSYLMDTGLLDKRIFFSEGEETGMVNVHVGLMVDDQILGMILVYNSVSGRDELTETDRFNLNALSVVGSIAMKTIQLTTQAQEEVIRDNLSGLKTEEYFKKRLQQEISRGKRYDVPHSLLLVDIDNFGEINEKFGENVGNEILRELGRVIKNSFRAIDIACRFRNDQFGIIFPHTSIENGSVASSRLQQLLDAPLHTVDDHPVKITVSGGLAGYPEDGDNREELYKQAELALYEAKQTGRNRIVSTMELESEDEVG